jgi:protein ImuA
MPFGIASIDEALGGGLSRAALHEIAAPGEAEIAAATGFTLALAARCAAPRRVLWIAEEMALMESGLPYGLGMDEMGLAPEAALIVTAARARDVLWAMEEALRCRAVGAVIGEIRRADVLDNVASRRLSLAASRQQTPAFLLRAQADARPVAAATRWVVGTAASVPIRQGTGPPVFDVRLVRNRYGRLGSWVLEWQRAEQHFDLASAHPQPMAAAAVDRPGEATKVA